MPSYIKGLFIPIKANNYRPRILEEKYFLFVLLFLCGIKALSFVSFENFLGADVYNQIERSDLYMLTNQVRKENNISELTPSAKLESAAQMKLNDIFEHNYFAHTSPAGVTPWSWIEKANYEYNLAGENLAMNFFSSDQAMKAWLNSESHKHNILLKDFSDIGIAVGSGKINDQNTIVVVQMFGKPRVPIVRTAQAQNQSVSASKPTLVKTPIPTPKVVVTKTPAPKPAVTNKPASSPNFIANTNPSASPKITPSVKPKINSEVKGLSAYSYNIFFTNMMVGLSVILMVILLLKIFVKINIQFPDLIFRALLLLVVSVAFMYLEDSQILNIINGNVILPN